MSFIKRFGFQIAFCGLILGTQAAQAGSVSLADWCINVSGTTLDTTLAGAGNNPSNSCNGGAATPLASVNSTGFDKTLEPGVNSLGSVTVTLGAGLSQFVGIYSDYDVDFATFSTADDSGSANGAVPAGLSYELDDPNSSFIFDDFASNSLSNANNVGTPSGPPTQCCDVAWALALSNINVLAGGTATVVFNVTTVAPTGGFYLTQTNADTKDSIYLTATVDVENPLNTAPEPSTFVLGMGVAAAALAMARRKRIIA